MRAKDLYPLVTARDLAAVRAFYVGHFGASTEFDSQWFMMLVIKGQEGERPFTLCFMTPDHPSRPPGPEPFDGKGMILTIEVDSVDDAFASLRTSGAPIDYGPVTEPWGQRRLMTRDPSGMLIDVVEQVAPAEGWWDKYDIRPEAME